MRRLIAIVTRENLEHARSPRLLSLALLGCLLTPLAVYVGRLDYQRRLGNYETTLLQRDHVQQGGKLLIPGFRAEPGLRLIRRPSVNAALVKGLEDAAPNYWDFSPWGVRAGNPARDTSSIFETAASIDLEFIIRVLLGLFAISLGADTIARERDTGALKMLFVQPVSRLLIAVGKLLAGIVTALVVVIAVIGIAAAVLSVTEPAFLTRTNVLSLVTLGLTSLFYLGTLYAAGMTIGQLASSTSMARLGAIMLWLYCAVISVPAVPFVAVALSPSPTRVLIDWQKERAYAAASREIEQHLGDLVRTAVGPDVSIHNVRIGSEMGEALLSRWTTQMAMLRAQLRAIDEGMMRTAHRQQWFMSQLAVFSPGALFLDSVANIVGTGDGALESWDRNASAYQAELERAVFFEGRPSIQLRVPGPQGSSLIVYERRSAPIAADFPVPDPPADTIGRRVAPAVQPLLGLLLYLVASWLAAVTTFRYRSTAPQI